MQYLVAVMTGKSDLARPPAIRQHKKAPWSIQGAFSILFSSYRLRHAILDDDCAPRA
jgi:hypothetical protein